MRWLYDNIITIHVAAVACLFAWVFGGTLGDWLTPWVPWMFVLVLEGMLCFPQRHDGETTYEARERVWEELRHDPLTWVVTAFIVLLIIPFLNVGLCPVCDYPQIIAGTDPAPAVPFLPYCVRRIEHLNVFLWFVPALVSMLAVKHALLKRGKRSLMRIIAWNGVGLSVLGAVQQLMGAEAPFWAKLDGSPAYFFSTFGYPNMAGDYFVTLFGISIGLWRWDVERARVEEEAQKDGGGKVVRDGLIRRHSMLIPAVLFFFSAFDTLSRATILLITMVAILCFLHSFACFFKRMKKAKRVKATAFSALALVLISLCTVVFMPEDVQKEVNTLGTTEVLDRVTGRGQYHVRVATEIWKDNLLFGCGGWGYKHFCIPKMTEKELRNIQQVGGINVHNDYLQFLAEHGLIGFSLLVAAVVLLLIPVGRTWRAMSSAIRFVKPQEQPPKPTAIFVLPAPAFCILLTATATFIHGFGDCPLRSPAVLTLFYVSLAAIDGFLPKLIKKEK